MDAVAVIRSSGERTEALCKKLAERQFDVLDVLRISPFSEAVRECFRIGIDSGAEWLATIDADVLIAHDYRERIAPEAEATDCWQVLGQMDDKLYGGIRQGGVRLYRVSALPDLIGRVRDDAVRPEADLCDTLGNWHESQVVTGSHDYEQFYRDLYRKGAAHRKKHTKWVELSETVWRHSSDRDLQAAHAGWRGNPLKFTEKDPL